MVWTQSDKVQKTFIISHPCSQIAEYGQGGWTVKWVKSWQEHWAQIIILSGSKSS